jgi:hypothetical protein
VGLLSGLSRGAALLAALCLVGALGGGSTPTASASTGVAASAPTAESVAAQARPKSWTRTYRVNKTGGAGVFTTINAAITALKADNMREFGDYVGPWPGVRFRILIDPGVYNETINTTGSDSAPTEAVPQFTDLIGSSGNRDDVVIWWNARIVPEQVDANYPWGKYDVPVMRTWGSAYIANLTLDLRGPVELQSHRTGVHSLSVGGNSVPTTIIVENVRMVSSHNATNGPNALDASIGDGAMNLFLGCDFEQTRGDCQAIQQSNGYRPERVSPGANIFIDCTARAPESKASVVNFLTVGGTGNVPADVQAWIGGAIEKGSSRYQIHCLNYPTSHNGVFLVDPSIESVAVPAVPDSLVRATGPMPTLPVDGLTPATVGYIDQLPPGSIVGRVTGTGGMPLQGATISLVGRSVSATSSAEGLYSLSHVATGTVSVKIEKPGYVTRYSYVGLDINVTRTLDVELAVVPPRGQVSGRLTNGAGVAVSGVTVSLDSDQPVLSDLDGSYSLQDVEPGNHVVQFEKIGFPTLRVPVRVVSSETTLLSPRLNRLRSLLVVARTPSSSRLSVKRKKGVAEFTLGAVLSDPYGPVADKVVCLQAGSTDGKTWKTVAASTTDASGRVSRTVRSKRRGTVAYRWWVPDTGVHTFATTSAQRVTVK